MPSTWMLFGLLACGASGSDVPDCIDHGECAEGQACIADVCLDVDCMASSSCDIGQYCNPDSFSCVDGCLEDEDCRAGEVCESDTRTCESYGCRSTELDCPVGTSCNVSTGECIAASACGGCNVNNVNSCQGGGRGTSQYCLPYDDISVGYCFPECNRSDDSCPAGFYCYKNLPIGLLQTADVCIADCPWLTDNGYL